MLTDEQRTKLMLLSWKIKPSAVDPTTFVIVDEMGRRVFHTDKGEIYYFSTEEDAYNAIMRHLFPAPRS